MAPGEFGEVMRFAGLATDRAGKQAGAVGGNLQMQFVWLLAGLQPLIDQAPRRRHSKPQSQYRIRVHTRSAHLDLRQCASVLVTPQDAARWPLAILDRHCARWRGVCRSGREDGRCPVEPEDDNATRQGIKWGRTSRWKAGIHL
jgi:hypothetical protein